MMIVQTLLDVCDKVYKSDMNNNVVTITIILVIDTTV